jgi:hypothetical protein
MMSRSIVAEPIATSSWRGTCRRAADYLALTKPRVVLMVLITTLHVAGAFSGATSVLLGLGLLACGMRLAMSCSTSAAQGLLQASFSHRVVDAFVCQGLQCTQLSLVSVNEARGLS